VALFGAVVATMFILELAERTVRLSGHVVGTDSPIRLVGVRQGEKLVEDLQDPRSSATLRGILSSCG
jgi:FlaA1/EpsC-like NDP-sugar epimerase